MVEGPALVVGSVVLMEDLEVLVQDLQNLMSLMNSCPHKVLAVDHKRP